MLITYFILGLLILVFGLSLILMVKVISIGKVPTLTADLERMERMTREDARDLRQELGESLIRFHDSIRRTVSEQMAQIRAENTEKLEMMRATVDEKLHATLEKRLGESFSLVSERLEKVHRELGEIQNLSHDVGGLKRILSNVKVRGTWGEVQLGSLLEQILSPDQYLHNAKPKENSQEVIEFVVCLPDDVWIPIDSKFPTEDYERLMAAAENADSAAMEQAAHDLAQSIKTQAKRISDKYIAPPKTTDFAIMFLPTEGLYAEVMKQPGLAAEVQQKYRISIAGPSTLGAFLNSLQMGFRTLAIQKRSGEVWQVLGEAKTEFEKYADWIDKVKRNIEQAHKVLDEAGTRTRAVNRRLRSVETNIKTMEEPLPETARALIDNRITHLQSDNQPPEKQ